MYHFCAYFCLIFELFRDYNTEGQKIIVELVERHCVRWFAFVCEVPATPAYATAT